MLQILGDSLADSGNLFNLGELAEAPGISDFKAAEEGGLVLAEALAVELGLIGSFDDDFSDEIDLFDVADDNQSFDDPIVNYAYFSAQSSAFGGLSGRGGNLTTEPYGLVSQATNLASNYRENKEFAKAYKNSDALLIIGSNDINVALQDNQTEIIGSLLSPDDATDDQAIIDGITGQVVGNVAAVLNTIDRFIDDVVLIGPPSLEKIPFVLTTSGSIGNVLGSDIGNRFLKFVESLVDSVNEAMVSSFTDLKNKSEKKNIKYNDSKQDILVLNGSDIFDSVPGVGFLTDGVHPDGASSEAFAEQIADLITPLIPDFGLG